MISDQSYPMTLQKSFVSQGKEPHPGEGRELQQRLTLQKNLARWRKEPSNNALVYEVEV